MAYIGDRRKSKEAALEHLTGGEVAVRVGDGGHVAPSGATAARGEGPYAAVVELTNNMREIHQTNLNRPGQVDAIVRAIAHNEQLHTAQVEAFFGVVVSSICTAVAIEAGLDTMDLSKLLTQHATLEGCVVLDRGRNPDVARIENAVVSVTEKLKAAGVNLSNAKVNAVYKALVTVSLSVAKNRNLSPKPQARDDESG
jgi:hypothetical protein